MLTEHSTNSERAQGHFNNTFVPEAATQAFFKYIKRLATTEPFQHDRLRSKSSNHEDLVKLKQRIDR
jgi:hypothetical protein